LNYTFKFARATDLLILLNRKEKQKQNKDSMRNLEKMMSNGFHLTFPIIKEKGDELI
jgi:hypothetical protein